ncbi:MFS transporter [Nocardia neocaledoniensis NBRC 108232]|uniref:Putative MFS transporter n=1 Tax=Nocardia neocaledoniensis TaxID=236511 RepID=A0A317NI59_9NOCA|nr:MFS transporter [Nocardia neocaledoniensis]PWV75001.1 putative MFS transporter [Nocardia neocaledoniensis]GEM30936.1 MFS transporter [Nocardia neocaledoniensis NBRC 108232]
MSLTSSETPPPIPSPASSPGLAAALDRIGFGRVQAVVIALLMAGLFFDSLEQNSTGAMGPLLKESFGIGNAELTLINTATVIGGLVGRLIGGYLADRWGRRTALSLNLLVYTLGGLISAAAVNYEILLTSRFIVGIGLGGEFTVGLAILAEMVATRHRGSLLATLNISSGGIGNIASFGFFALVLGPLGALLGGDDTSWRWTYVILAVPAVLVVFFRRYLPESPRFLLSKGRVAEANLSLTRLGSGSIAGLRDPGPVVDYVSAADIPRQTRSSYVEVFKGRNGRRVAAIGAASWMSFGAQVTLLFLMPILLVSRGYSLTDSLAFTMIMNIGSLFGACAASYLAGRAPRRPTVMGAAVLGCLSAIAFALFATSTVLLLTLGMIFQFFTMMLNTMLSVWSPELFPTSVRAMGASVVNGIGNVAGAVMPFAALFFFDRAGVPGVFAMIAVMYALLVVAARFGPETFGKPLEVVSGEAATADAPSRPLREGA